MAGLMTPAPSMPAPSPSPGRPATCTRRPAPTTGSRVATALPATLAAPGSTGRKHSRATRASVPPRPIECVVNWPVRLTRPAHRPAIVAQVPEYGVKSVPDDRGTAAFATDLDKLASQANQCQPSRAPSFQLARVACVPAVDTGAGEIVGGFTGPQALPLVCLPSAAR